MDARECNGFRVRTGSTRVTPIAETDCRGPRSSALMCCNDIPFGLKHVPRIGMKGRSIRALRSALQPLSVLMNSKSCEWRNRGSVLQRKMNPYWQGQSRDGHHMSQLVEILKFCSESRQICLSPNASISVSSHGMFALFLTRRTSILPRQLGMASSD